MVADALEGSTRRSLMAGLIGAATIYALPLRAQETRFQVPIVDTLTLTVLTDSGTFGPFLPDLELPGLKVLRAGNGSPSGYRRMSPKALMGEFGLSLLADSRVGGVTRRVLVDFGYTAEVLANNMGMLGIDPSSIDASVLSHGHLDHYGGFPALARNSASKDRPLPLYVGGEESFCERVAMIGDPPPVMGILDRGALLNAGFDVRIAPKPAIVADQSFTTGVIPLETSERTAIPTRMRPGTGCDRKGLRSDKRDLTEVTDDGEHELATCYALKELGLVVIASCSHRGVLNSVRRAQAISGIEKVHMVIGGFHLVRPRTEEEARQTVAAFKDIDPDYIVPMHCTGEVFIEEALRLLPKKVVRPYVGMRLVLG
jgi:7,8-dihydropterin-6-yl-methyl-4-(beta-D-ribofuranosyl)aminobenzene 5'-phosphate synthase